LVEFLNTYETNVSGTSGDFYRTVKPILCESGIFPNWEVSNLEPGSYLRFQKNLQYLSSLPLGMNLAMSMMVDVNVACGILSYSESSLARDLLIKISSGDCILATGVSEPGWEGSLKKIKSTLDDNFKLTGVKSFITNGISADAILWVVPHQNQFHVYIVKLDEHTDCLTKESISTPFLQKVSHLKLTLSQYPLSPDAFILSDYAKIGMELRLKELFSLVSLLLGFVSSLDLFGKTTELLEAWKALEVWRDHIASRLTHINCYAELIDAFPFPSDSLLVQVAKVYGLSEPKDLPSIHPDFAIFIWEDSLVKYLLTKKSRQNRLT
jgi:hypothetical protein